MNDRLYLLERAEQEIAAAQRANHEQASRAHYMLAGFYLDRAHRLHGRQACAPDLG
jgi:hypothetical protein